MAERYMMAAFMLMVKLQMGHITEVSAYARTHACVLARMHTHARTYTRTTHARAHIYTHE